MICQVADCDLTHYGRGYCQKHYSRWYRYGDPQLVQHKGRRPQDVGERIARRSVPAGECLIYTGRAVNRSGHRQIWRDGRMASVHRVAYEVAHGPVPTGLVVMHRCDNPPCVNPAHLVLGTVADNNRDRDRKGRHRPLPGSSNGNARLAEWKVAEIKARLACGETQAVLAREYGTAQSNVSLIKLGHAWPQVKPANWLAAA